MCTTNWPWPSPRREAVPVILGMVLTLLLAGCARPTPTPEPAIVRFVHPETESAYYQALAREFEQSHPAIRIQVSTRSYRDLATVGAADTDVFAEQNWAQRRERSEILSLDQFMAADKTFDKADFWPAALELCAGAGKTWALPQGVDPLVMLYNRDRFDERRVPYPKPGWTWDDFLNTAVLLSDPQAGIYGYADQGSAGWVLFVLQHGGQFFDNWEKPSRATFAGARTAEALQWYADLVHKYHVAPSPEEARSAGQSPSAGKVGMWMEPYSALADAERTRPGASRPGIATLPRDKHAITLANVHVLAISAQAKHPQACWEWVSFLSRQVPSRYVPARVSVAQSAEYERIAGSEAAAVARTTMRGTLLTTFPEGSPFVEKAGAALMQAVGEIMAGRVAVREALQHAEEQANQ